MKKIYKKVLSIIFIICITISTFKYTKVFADNIKSILNINNTSNIDENINIKVNLDNIEYNKFKFILSSNTDIKNVELNTNEIDIINNNNEIIFEYDKNISNLSEINLIYTIPENIVVGDKIKFNVEIINLENEEEKLVEEYEVNVTEKLSNSNIISNDNTSNSDVISSNISSDIPSDDNIIVDEKKEDTNQDKINISIAPSSNNKNNTPSQTKNISVVKVSSNNVVNSVSIPKEEITYNGSDNNYLSDIKIDGYELNREFKKECTTYFITVSSDTDKIEIDTTKDESTSKVSISGNDNISTGLNKVLINVTAQNGNIRTYRIYVTKESD